MDGYTATQRIRDLDDSRAEIPIIAMTANAYDEADGSQSVVMHLLVKILKKNK